MGCSSLRLQSALDDPDAATKLSGRLNEGYGQVAKVVDARSHGIGSERDVTCLMLSLAHAKRIFSMTTTNWEEKRQNYGNDETQQLMQVRLGCCAMDENCHNK